LNNLKWDKTFLRVAKELGDMSHCVSRQVGAIAVLDGRILSSGINGTPKGELNCDEKFEKGGFGHLWDVGQHRAWSDIHEIHAEMNLIMFAAKHGTSLDNSTLYSTLQPCLQCCKNIMQVGVKRIVFAEYYDRVVDNQDLIKRLTDFGIQYDFVQI
jgi:dCMP deaminase